MVVDGQGVSCWIDTQSRHVTYHSTLAVLEQYPSMQLTNPPTQNVKVRVCGFYRDADAPLTGTTVKIRLKNFHIRSDIGLNFEDLINGIRHDRSFGRDLLDPDRDSSEEEDRQELLDALIDHGDLDYDQWEGDWDLAQQELGMTDLEAHVREHTGWKRVIRDPVIELDIFLEAGWDLRLPVPMVATGNEPRAVIKS
jgi:hypothetical protein